MHRRVLGEDEREDEKDAPAPAAEPAVLALQRSAGNAAVARILARKPLDTLDMRKPDLAVGKDYSAAMDAVYSWFESAWRQEGGLIQSVPELVHIAGRLTFTDKDGKPALVSDHVKPNVLEGVIRGVAKERGAHLPEHRAMDDIPGVEAEVKAIMAALGKIPSSFQLKGDAGKIEVSLAGKVSVEAGTKDRKVGAEASAEGGKVSATVPGAKVSVEMTTKGALKAEVKAGELVTVKGSVAREADGGVGWKAEITIGTIGRLTTPEDVAKVMVGAQETFGKSAGELARNLNDPEKIKVHGAALKDAVTGVVEKAKKSAKSKSGWVVGVDVKGDEGGAVSGSVTLTWVF
ncbi:MAG: hypothetical protein ACRDPC_04600 [Solirubrobacteraceae bacterium]